MKKIIYSLIVIVASMSMANAQDLVTKRNGEDIKAKVLEITGDEVKYRLYDEPDGVIYTVNKSDIVMIRYESGRNEIFDQNAISDSYYSEKEPVADIRPDMTYKELKKIYNHKDFTPSSSDRYRPGWTGVASALIPGLGETVNGEWKRGVGKFCGSVVLLTAGSIYERKSHGDDAKGWHIAVAAACYVGVVGLDVWSIVDAVRIAKVKNMYEQDLRRTYSFNLDLHPSVNFVQMGNTVHPTVGFTLALQF
jgi:hypothetical protein